MPAHPDSLNLLGRDFEGGQMARDMNLFVDEDGNGFNSLDKKDPPAPMSGPEAIELLNILKLNANRQGRRAARIDHSEDYMDDDFTGYGEELSSHLEDEGLSYSSKPY